MTFSGSYHYDVGDLVQLERGGQVHTVVWRGQLKVRSDDSLVVRLNVYRLDNAFWDCYHEYELATAWRWGPE